MERIKDQKYWYVRFAGYAFTVDSIVDGGDWFARGNHETGNYFPNRETAVAMASKLAAVMKGETVQDKIVEHLKQMREDYKYVQGGATIDAIIKYIEEL